jgi:hypothetical protein
MSLHCQCDRVGVDHSANLCPKVGTIRIDRNGVELWVCVDCIFSPDVKLDPEDDDWDEEDDVDWELERSIERSEMEAECARLNRLR